MWEPAAPLFSLPAEEQLRLDFPAKALPQIYRLLGEMGDIYVGSPARSVASNSIEHRLCLTIGAERKSPTVLGRKLLGLEKRPKRRKNPRCGEPNGEVRTQVPNQLPIPHILCGEGALDPTP